ncbi:hypothetical protein FACS1894110_09780 [Spirochaetia bacterium]|nr:hypothetical protein FACS1894110_09780 [Spirochaetia bacterium]
MAMTNINAGNVKGGTGDPGPGIAEGGTAGQILAKASDADFDTEWKDRLEGAVQLQSDSMQEIESDLSLDGNLVLEDKGAGSNAKILARDNDDNSTHEMLGLNDYGAGKKQAEVGSPKAPLCFNYALIAGWAEDIHPKVTYKPLSGPSVDERLAFVNEVLALADRVNAIGGDGHVVASFANFASRPTNVSGLPAGVKVGDGVLILADESQGGSKTKYYIGSIDVSGVITWVDGGTVENEVNDILIADFTGNAIGALIPNDGKPYEIYWQTATPGAPSTSAGSGIATRIGTNVFLLAQESTGLIQSGTVTAGTASTPTWKTPYIKPSGGIPKTDLETAVQESLGKADAAQPALKASNGTDPLPADTPMYDKPEVDTAIQTAIQDSWAGAY